MKPERYIEKQLRRSQQDCAHLGLKLLAAKWDAAVTREANRNGIVKTARKYGLEVETVEYVAGRPAT